MSEKLYIVTCVSNPIGWKSRIDLAVAAVKDWLSEPNVEIYLAECIYGSRKYELDNLVDDPRYHHIKLRATTMAWSKENLLNEATARLPPEAQKIVFVDADVQWRRDGWASATLKALDLYPVVQPWNVCYDLGPHDEHITAHQSFASVFHAGKPVLPLTKGFWKSDGGPYDYPHSGYAWAWNRRSLDRVGGLIEVGGMGSGDHHMALGIIGKPEWSLPENVSKEYRSSIVTWSNRAVAEVNYKIGFVHGTIEHPFHGRKGNRKYQDRWNMFIKHSFNPHVDLKKNSYGVIEFAGNKPDLERDWDHYLREREEDVNTLT